MPNAQGQPEQGRARFNFRSRGGALARAMSTGLVVAALGSAASIAYLELAWAPHHETALAQRVSQALAQSEAARVHQYLMSLRNRATRVLSAVAASPPEQQQRAGVAGPLAEKELRQLFPEAVDLRLLPLGALGTAGATRDDLGLRSHIEVDLVRRAGTEQTTLQESFEHEGQWLTALAMPTPGSATESGRTVLLLVLDNAGLLQRASLPEPAGSTVLQQLYRDSKGREHVQKVAATGDAGSDNSDLTAHAPVPESPWRVAFTPNQPLLESLSTDRRGLYAATAMGALGALGGVLLTGSLYRRKLRRESRQLLKHCASGEKITFSVPELAAIARQLRGDDDANPADPPALVAGNGGASQQPPPGTSAAPAEAADQVLELDLVQEPIVALESGPVPAHIFRAYDIRGHAENELGDALIRQIGRVVADMVLERGQDRIVVGSDGRISSPRLRSQLIDAILQAGLDVIDIGLVPTPLLHFALYHLDCGSGIMVTGSHNPAQDNGLKIVLDRQTLAAGAIQEIYRRILTPPADAGRNRGRISGADVTAAYIAELTGDIVFAVPLKIVIDAGNGVTGLVAPQLFRELGCEVVPLFCEVDGRFPNHSPDTSVESNLETLCATVVAEQADLGVAFDGDGDRLAVVSPAGKIVRTDRLMMLFADDVVSRNPGSDVVFDVKCSRALARLITDLGGRPVMWKTGHALMKQKVAETGALLGGEFSGHIFFGERWYGHDDGMYAAVRLAELVSARGETLDEALAQFPQTVNTPELRVAVPEREKFALMEEIVQAASFEGARVTTLDGIRVDFDCGWGLLRASNTTAALTARFEADSEEHLAAITQSFRELVAQVAPQLELSF